MRLSRRNTMTLLGAASACFALASPLAFAATRQWSSTHFAKSPLVGNIYDRSGLSGQTLDDLKDRAAASRHVMLGEIHPNPDHHRLQAEFLVPHGRQGPQTCRGFRNGHTGPAAHPGQADGQPARRPGQIAQRLNWKDSGWPDFAMYQPLFEIGLKNNLRLQAGNLEKSTVRRLGGRIGSRLSDTERARLGLDKPLPEAAGKDMLEVIRTAHCNMLPDTVLPFMRDIQRARDHVMSAAMLDTQHGRCGADLRVRSCPARLGRRLPCRARQARQPALDRLCGSLQRRGKRHSGTRRPSFHPADAQT
jgi:uncharacterized iron-regulated protein